jgi:[ribosomal protein S5]-alanine N-acetyltransferase
MVVYLRMDYFLTSERLGFRCWREDDLPLAIELFGDPAVAAMMGTPATPEAARARLDREIARMAESGIQYWLISLLDGGEFVGCAGVRPVTLSPSHPFHKEREKEGTRSDQPLVFELGYHLLPKHWGRGLATEAARAVIDYAFGALAADALFAGHHPSNDRSRRVLLKVGFEYAGDEVYPPTGWIEPTYLLRRYEILAAQESNEPRALPGQVA